MFAALLTLTLMLDPVVADYRSRGLDRVAAAYRVADPSYREAISNAVQIVDPDGERPWLTHELWRICMRESRCGQYGSPGVHGRDSWTGERSYARAVQRGRLDPEHCAEHRLDGRTVEDFSTRGGFGQNAARALRWLGPCAPPEALDNPQAAALAAAWTLVKCERDGRACTCSERAALWIGRGILDGRPLISRSGRSRFGSVAVQCGDLGGWAYLVREILIAYSRLASATID